MDWAAYYLVVSQDGGVPRPWDYDYEDSRSRRRRLRRQHAVVQANADDSGERTSIWKREISLGRRSKSADAAPPAEQVEPEVPSADAEEQPRQSIWKREISFGRRGGAAAGAPGPDDEPQDDEVQDDEVQDGEPQSYESLRDELEDDETPRRKRGFRRRRRSEDAVAAAEPVEPEPFEPESFEHDPVVPEQEPERAQKPSIWKREISFGRRPGAEEPEPEPEPETDPDPDPDPDPESPLAAEVEWPQQAPPEAAEPLVPEPARPEVAYGWPDPAPAEAADPVDSEHASPEADHGWATSESELVDPAPAAEPETVWPEAEARQADAASVWPEPEPEAVSPEPVPIQPPAPEADVDSEPEPVEEPAERRPSKRRKLSRRRESAPMRKPDKQGKGAHRGKNVKRIVGLKLGASQVAAAYVRNNGSHEVVKVARSPLERGVVVAGELRDGDALAKALRDFFKANKLPKRFVRIGLASNRVGVRVLDVEGVEDPKLLDNAVRFRAQEVLPIPLSDAVLDYKVLGETTDENGATVRKVLVAFAYRELVDRYVSACQKAGLRLVGIDLEGFALLRALVDPEPEAGRPAGVAVVTVSIGHDRSIMAVSDGRNCEFTRVIEWGGSELDTAVARILALTPSQAEPIKKELSLDPNAPTPVGLAEEQATRARSAMQHEVSAFAREFVSSLQFYQAQPGSLDIGEIVVTGGTAELVGLVDELQRLIGVAVRRGNPLGRSTVVTGKRVSDDEPLSSLGVAIGLGIED